jgi:hypothetical protein
MSQASAVLSNWLQSNWTLSNPAADAIDWLTDRDSIAKWNGDPSSNSICVGCFEVGGQSGRSSVSAVWTEELVEVKVKVKGQASTATNQGLRITVFNAVRALLTGNLNSLIGGNLKVSALRNSGAFDVSQFSSRDVIVTLQYPEGS